MTEPLLLGLDLGQTVIKASVFDTGGRRRGQGRAMVTIDAPRPGWQERDMGRVWQAAASVIRQALGSVGARDGVRAVGLSGHGDGLHLVDAGGRPVRPAITALDTRAALIARRLRVGPLASCSLEMLGQAAEVYGPPALLTWLKENEPDSLDRTRWVLSCKDWVRYRLTGEIGTDRTDASAGFLGMRTGRYAGQAFEMFGLPEVADRLPAVFNSSDVAGVVSADAAEATGLPVGTPVVYGAHDVAAAAVGMGAVAPGSASIILGTFSINQVVSDEPRPDHRWQARAFTEPGRWLHMSTSPTGTATFDWLAARLRAPEGSRADGVAGAIDTGLSAGVDATAPFWLPFLFGSPIGSAGPGGCLVGLRPTDGAANILAAGLEGVAFMQRWHLAALAEVFELKHPIRATGGGVRSAGLTQLIADVCGRPIAVGAQAEAGSLGAALLAGVGVGLYRTVDEAAALVSGAASVREPDLRWDAAQEVRYERWLTLASALGG